LKKKGKYRKSSIVGMGGKGKPRFLGGVVALAVWVQVPSFAPNTKNNRMKYI